MRVPPVSAPCGHVLHRWLIGLNTLYEEDSAEEGIAPGPAIFHAVNEGRRFLIDVEWEPELDEWLTRRARWAKEGN